MVRKPLISVVLPVYNLEAYIHDALASILNQSVQDFEIIVIDDGSTDSTVKIIESIKDDRIRILKKPINKGLIDSLNIGFKEAKGVFVARMDGDDANAPNRFEKQLKVLQENPEIKACGCWLQCFGVSSKIIKHKEHHMQIQAQLLLGNPMSLGATMIKREAYTNYKFDATKLHAEDYDFWAKSGWDCQMYNIQEVLYHYRTHENQVSSLYNEVQKNQDISIKLHLYHKIDYNKIIFEDSFIKKLLFSNDGIDVEECVLLFKWFNELIGINKNQHVFGNIELLEVIEALKRRFVLELFFTNHRKGMDYNLRMKILKVLPFKEKLFVARKKIKEKLTILKNKKNN